MLQRIRYVRSDDGVSIAWAEAGRGLPLVKAANWLTHLEYDWESPVWRHWTRFFARHFHYVRHDERGCGLSDRAVGDLSFPRWVDDLERVIDAARLDRRFALIGISQGAAAAVAYAVRHPERVSHLVLYGGYVVGAHRRGEPDAEAQFRAITEVMRVGWGQANPQFRQLFTSRFVPDATPAQLEWFNELCIRTTTPEIGAALMGARGEVDARELLAQVQVPTLVVHCAGDQVVPVAEGQRLARGIPGASFVQLESRNHVLLEHEPAWQQFQQVLLDFTGQARAQADDGGAALATPRERAALALLCEGASNAEIAARLGIAEKTVRNHLSNLYDKLGVHSRAAAIAYAHQHGLSPRGD